MTINKYACCLLMLLPFLDFPSTISAFRIQERKPEDSWKLSLYADKVQYENFACNKGDSETVKTFFQNYPLDVKLPICHNDCPIIKCRPVVPFPAIAKSTRVAGKISVHVLVDEKGKVLYARVLSGHPLLRAAARNGACETQFKEHSVKHQGVLHFNVDGYEFLNVPNRANEVW